MQCLKKLSCLLLGYNLAPAKSLLNYIFFSSTCFFHVFLGSIQETYLFLSSFHWKTNIVLLLAPSLKNQNILSWKRSYPYVQFPGSEVKVSFQSSPSSFIAGVKLEPSLLVLTFYHSTWWSASLLRTTMKVCVCVCVCYCLLLSEKEQ